MLSRIADSLYWTNRYMERAACMLRLASTHYVLYMDKDTNQAATWSSVLQLHVAPVDGNRSPENNTAEALKQLLVSDANANSLKAIVSKARENARGAQDYITKEVWEQINQMYHLVNNPSMTERLNSFQALDVMVELTRQSTLYAGIIDVTMPRGTGWWFMSIGRFIERCLQTITLAEKQLEDMKFAESDDNDILQWRYLLLSLSGYELHLKTYRSSNHNFNVLHQVLINDDFSHSIVYSLRRTGHYLDKIIGHKSGDDVDLLSRMFGRLYAKLRYVDLGTLDRTTVQLYLKELRSDLLDFNRQFAHHFFSYS